MLRKWIINSIALVLAIGLVGCGGGGGTSGNAGGGNANIFLTDDINGKYDQVWATVTKVDLVSQAGQTTNVYDGTTTGGQVVDLRSLHGTSGQQFFHLSGFTAPTGTYVSANVTLASALSMVPTGSTHAVAASFSGSNAGSIVVSAKFDQPQDLAASPNVVLDFNLANWNLTGTTVSAPNGQFVQFGTTTGLTNPLNMKRGDYFGLVSNLSSSSGIQKFSIARGPSTVNVVTSAATVLYNADGSPNPTLSNGELVDVAGTFDAANNVVVALAIIVRTGPISDHPERVVGLVTADDLGSNTITLQLNGCTGFMPTTTVTTVSVNASTTFIDGSGVTDTEAQFFAKLAPGSSMIEVEGKASDSAFVATSVRIGPGSVVGSGGSGGGEGDPGPLGVADRGTVSNINVTAHSFTLTVDQWMGGLQCPNQVVTVITSASTQYFVKGTVEAADTFFATLKDATVLSVFGKLDPKTPTVMATTIALDPPVIGLKAGKLRL